MNAMGQLRMSLLSSIPARMSIYGGVKPYHNRAGRQSIETARGGRVVVVVTVVLRGAQTLSGARYTHA